MKSRTTKKKSKSPTETILESISDGVFTVDLKWRITSFNRAAEEITATRREEAVGRLCSEVFRCSMCENDCALRRTIKTGKPIIGQTGYIINAAERRLPISVSTAVLRDQTGRIIGGAETFRDLSELEELRQELKGRYRVGELSSRSPIMQRVFEVLPAIAASPSTVLILGETGTGKELIARTIHEQSPRKNKPFIAVNCNALPETLLESELFGYRAGAFTGAHKNKPGRFSLANGGTLFLDEIGEISPALQTKLLRVLQERSFEPLGATRSERVDVRIIVAANKDLMELVRQGAFREDLYYRVNVVRIELPPLRRRKEDIPLMVEQFISRFNRQQGKNVAGITAQALALLMAHDWPGNVRELENEIERAFILCDRNQIDIAQLSDQLTNRRDLPPLSSDIRTIRSRMDSQTIRNALQQAGNNRLLAAQLLGIHKTTLYRQMKKLGIRPERKKKTVSARQGLLRIEKN